ncbi:MAG: hypothetical protein JO129_03245 [Candidatus Dependentiae bacterium]|nr:hypothetical protein [Candidatus Dependentiae bacterium]
MKHDRIKHDLIKHAEEREAIESFIQLDKSCSLQQFPLTLQLDTDDSIPDAIVMNKKDGLLHWLEVVTISRTAQEREEVGKFRNGEIWQDDELLSGEIFDLQLFEDETYQQICNAIYKKNQKNYTKFSELYRTKIRGTLIVRLINFRPFLDTGMISKICDKFNKNVLLSLHCDKPVFDRIVLIADLLIDHRYTPYESTIADEGIMQRLQEHN